MESLPISILTKAPVKRIVVAHCRRLVGGWAASVRQLVQKEY